VEIVINEAARSEFVDIRGGHPATEAPVAAEVAETGIVQDDYDNIGRSGGWAREPRPRWRQLCNSSNPYFTAPASMPRTK
jgi:hypothetical protein